MKLRNVESATTRSATCRSETEGSRVGRTIEEMHGEMEILRKKNIEVQMMKFGQEVDLDALQQRSVNTTAEMLEAKCRKIELRQMKQLAQAQEDIRAAQIELSNATKENTMRLARLADLTAEQHRLEMSLNSTQGQLAGGESSVPPVWPTVCLLWRVLYGAGLTSCAAGRGGDGRRGETAAGAARSVAGAGDQRTESRDQPVANERRPRVCSLSV